MSREAQLWAINQPLRNPVKVVLFVLAYRDGRNYPHGCYPSLNRIAFDCGLSRTTVVQCLKELVAQGIIERTPTYKAGRQTTSWYTFPLVPYVETVNHLNNGDQKNTDTGGRVRHAPSAGQPAARHGGQPHCPQKVLNLKEEKKDRAATPPFPLPSAYPSNPGTPPRQDPRIGKVIAYYRRRLKEMGIAVKQSPADPKTVAGFFAQSPATTPEQFCRWMENAWSSTLKFPLQDGWSLQEFGKHYPKYSRGPLIRNLLPTVTLRVAATKASWIRIRVCSPTNRRSRMSMG